MSANETRHGQGDYRSVGWHLKKLRLAAAIGSYGRAESVAALTRLNCAPATTAPGGIGYNSMQGVVEACPSRLVVMEKVTSRQQIAARFAYGDTTDGARSSWGPQKF